MNDQPTEQSIEQQEAPQRHWVPCVGGPLHMRTVHAPANPQNALRPLNNLAVMVHHQFGSADLDKDGRVPRAFEPMTTYASEGALYYLAPARVGDAGLTGGAINAYRFSGTERDSWGHHNDICDLDESIGRPQALGDDIHWVRFNAHRERHADRDRRDRWALVLPAHLGPTVTVYRTLPVIRSNEAYHGALALRPAFPLWIDERFPL